MSSITSEANDRSVLQRKVETSSGGRHTVENGHRRQIEFALYRSVFHGNRDLRPILLYEGFVGHPLRKDYAKQHEQPLVPYSK